MKIYLDNCCFCRPFDEQGYDSIALETKAVLIILDKCETVDTWSFCSSDILDEEISRIFDIIKKQKVYNLYSSAGTHIALNDDIIFRARELEKLHITPFDALHLAGAEYGNVDVFLTTDRKLINKAKQSDLKIRVENPLVWLMEELNEQ